MMLEPSVSLMHFHAEHKLRERRAQRFRQATSAVRAGHDRTERTVLRLRAGRVLVSLGRRLGRMPSPVASRP